MDEDFLLELVAKGHLEFGFNFPMDTMYGEVLDKLRRTIEDVQISSENWKDAANLKHQIESELDAWRSVFEDGHAEGLVFGLAVALPLSQGNAVGKLEGLLHRGNSASRCVRVVKVDETSGQLNMVMRFDVPAPSAEEGEARTLSRGVPAVCPRCGCGAGTSAFRCKVCETIFCASCPGVEGVALMHVTCPKGHGFLELEMLGQLGETQVPDDVASRRAQPAEDRHRAEAQHPRPRVRAYVLGGLTVLALAGIVGIASWAIPSHDDYIVVLEQVDANSLIFTVEESEAVRELVDRAARLTPEEAERTVTLLVGLVRDGADYRNCTLIRAIGNIAETRGGMQEPDVVPVLIGRLDLSMCCAERALGQIGDRRAVAPILETLADAAFVPSEKLVALRSLGGPEVVAGAVSWLAADRYRDRQLSAIRLLEWLVEDGDMTAMAPLIDAVQRGTLRSPAARALGRVGDGRALDALRASLAEASGMLESSDLRAAIERIEARGR